MQDADNTAENAEINAENIDQSDEQTIDEFQAEVENMQQLMAQTETGSVMLERSQEMAASEEMITLMESIGSPKIAEDERVTLAEYMGNMLKENPETGLDEYAKYLESVASDPTYAQRKDIYLTIADAAKKVNSTQVYKDYIVAYQAFEADTSQEAQNARIATEQMQEKMRKWSETT